jgi:cobalt-zinc-cadmium efflux system membrane fusion protein
MNKNIVIILTLGSLVACKNSENKVADNKAVAEVSEVVLTKDQLGQANLKYANFELGEMASTMHLNGKIDVPPTAMASVSVPLGGYIQEIRLIPGMFVKKGAVIAMVKDPMYIQLQEDYLTAKSKELYLSQDLERQKQLLQDDAVSKKSFQQVQAEYTNTQIQLKALSEKLKLINIDASSLKTEGITSIIKVYAPISGYVSKVNISKGKYASPTDILLELVDPTDIHAALTVYEKDLVNLKEGMKGEVVLSTSADKKYPVSIMATSKNLDDDRSALVHCHFKELPKNVYPGMFLTADFAVVVKNAVVVPSSAVQRYQGEDFIFLKKNDSTFTSLKVKVSSVNNQKSSLVDLNFKDVQNFEIVSENAYSLLGKLKNKL